MKVGLLTGGGDSPGLNAVIRAVVQRISNEGGSCVGILEGWRGLVKNMTIPLDVEQTDGIVGRGGHDPRVLPHQPVQVPRDRPARRLRERSASSASTPSSPSAATTPWASPTASTKTSACPSSASRRPSTTTCS